MKEKSLKSAETNGPIPTGETLESRGGTGGRHSRARNGFVRHVLESKAETSVDLRRAAAGCDGLPQHLGTLVEKIHKHSYKIVDDDIDAARAECGEDEIFEIILSACIGASEQRLMAGLRAVEEAK